MKQRMILMAVAVLMATAAVAQGLRPMAQTRQMIDLYSQSNLDAMMPEVTPNGEWQKVVPSDMTAKESYRYARQVLAKIVPDYHRSVQLEDTADCKIVVAVAVPLMAQATNGYWYKGQYNMTLTLTMKDNRYRVSGDNMKCQTGNEMNVPGIDTSQGLPFNIVSGQTNGNMQRDLQQKAGLLVALIDFLLKKQKSDNDF